MFNRFHTSADGVFRARRFHFDPFSIAIGVGAILGVKARRDYNKAKNAQRALQAEATARRKYQERGTAARRRRGQNRAGGLVSPFGGGGMRRGNNLGGSGGTLGGG